MECIIISITCKDKAEAQRISGKLLEEHLVACVNIIDQVSSFFHWKGKVENAREVLVLMKTRRDLFDAVKHVVKDMHSYDVPEIVAVPIVDGDENYLKWIREETQIDL